MINTKVTQEPVIIQKLGYLDGRDTSLVYYDVTNFYFETDSMDDFKTKGVSKEHRPNPIVQMGLFTDNNAIPIAYHFIETNLSFKSFTGFKFFFYVYCIIKVN